MTDVTWYKITANKRSVEPTNKARVWVRNDTIGRPARWDAKAREWYWKSAACDWRASAMCYPEWRDWDALEQEPVQPGLGL